MIYKTVAMESANWQVRIAPDYGANPVSVRCRGKDILVPWTPNNTNPFLVGSPLLLPSNRTANGCFTFEGQTYHLPVNEANSGAHLHGDLYHQSFLVVEHREDQVCLEYENHGEIYPFPFRVRVRYQVGEAGFCSSYVIENLSETPIPVTFGLHTTFAEPQWFRVPLLQRQEKDEKHIPTGRYVPLNAQEEGYCIGSASAGLTISGYYAAAGDTARIGQHLCYQVTGFDHWILYNGGGTSDFLCIEPQLGAVDGLNNPVRCPVIPGKGELRLGTRLFWDK